MRCPRCHVVLVAGDRFCSDCGVRIAVSAPPSEGGRAEALGPGLAGQTDRGRRHAHNEDAFILSGPPDGGHGTVVVVCDGVSSSQTPAAAAQTAARVAHAALRGAHETGRAGTDAMRAAIRLAHEAVCDLPFDRQGELDPPATTLVAAAVHTDGVILGWVGDSRAYRLGPPAKLLTRDHSWLETVLAQGDIPEDVARRDPRAHALVRCLGTAEFDGASPCPDPGLVEIPATAGWLLLCSDGLWRYAESPAAMTVAAGTRLEGDAVDLCARLVDFALLRGGQDNVTIAALRLSGPSRRNP